MNTFPEPQIMRETAQTEIQALTTWQKVANKHGLRITTQFALAELLAVVRCEQPSVEQWHTAMQHAWQVSEDIQDALERSELEHALIQLKQIHGDDFEAAWNALLDKVV